MLAGVIVVVKLCLEYVYYEFMGMGRF